MATATSPKGASLHSTNGHSISEGTVQQRRLLTALHAFRRGDFSVRLPVTGQGIEGDIARLFNECLEQKSRMLSEVKRVSRVIARDGRLSQRAVLEGAQGSRQEHIDTYNLLIESVAAPMAETTALSARSRRATSRSAWRWISRARAARRFPAIGARHQHYGRPLNAFASEATRVAREWVEGKLGGQAAVKGVAGMWKDLTDSVNTMAGNLTNQVRNIADVTHTAVAKGDLSRKITVEARDSGLKIRLTPWSTGRTRSRAKSRALRVKSAPKVNWAGRPRFPAFRARGKT